MPASALAMTNGDAAAPEPPSSLLSDDGTITETSTAETM